ncbi:MAG: glycoside hydrolase N-terminal domain-containing protein, partial [Arachnia sp.]
MVPTLSSTAAAEVPTKQDPLVMTYGAPAPLNRWQEESLSIGNGAMGASVFGQVNKDELLLNEKTLWTGGPGVPGYRFGNYPEGQVEQRRENLQEVRDTINEKGTMSPGEVAGLLGQPKVGYGNYQSFGKLQFDYTHGAGTPTNYQRSLDLNRSLAKVEYSVGDVRYTREYFASFVDDVIAMRVTADQPGRVTFATTYNRNASASVAVDQQGLAQASIAAGKTGR